MKKILGILLGAIALLLPAVALATYNDVTIGADVTISSNSVSFTSVASSSVESLLVDTNSFNVAVAPSSSFDARSANGYLTGVSTATTSGYSAATTCESGGTSLTSISSVDGTTTVTVTPNTTACPSAGPSGGGSSSSSSGGGGGGGGGPIATTQTTTSTTTTTTSTTQTTPSTSATTQTGTQTSTQTSAPATAGIAFSEDFGIGAENDAVVALQTFLENKGFLTIPSGIAKGYFGGLTRVAVRAYQKSMGISQTGYVGPKTRAALNGDVLVPAASAAPSTTPSATVVFGAFTRDLEIGMTGDDVKALQVFLNTHGYEVAASGPGSSGNETSRPGGRLLRPQDPHNSKRDAINRRFRYTVRHEYAT